MAQREPEKTSIDQLLHLVQQLSYEEQQQFRRRLDLKSWSDEWKRLQDEIEETRVRKNLPPISEEEIYSEFNKYRRSKKAERDQGAG